MTFVKETIFYTILIKTAVRKICLRNTKNLKNKIQRDIKKAESEYFLSELEANKSNSKQLWKQLKVLGYSEKNKRDKNIVLEIDGKLCFDSTKIAQHFNEFLTNIASKLVDKLPKCSSMFSVASSAFQDYCGSKLTNSNKLHLSPVCEEFVEKGASWFKSFIEYWTWQHSRQDFFEKSCRKSYRSPARSPVP